MMQKAHNLKFKDSQLTDKDLSWDIGYYVVAKFHLDKMWYRAKILDVSLFSCSYFKDSKKGKIDYPYIPCEIFI